MKGFIKLFSIIFVIGLVAFAVHWVYLDINYYLSPSYDERQKISQITLEKNSPDECYKIKNSPLAIMEPSEKELINNCLINFALATKNIEVCKKHVDYRGKFYDDERCSRLVTLLNKEKNNCGDIASLDEQILDGQGSMYCSFRSDQISKNICSNIKELVDKCDLAIEI